MKYNVDFIKKQIDKTVNEIMISSQIPGLSVCVHTQHDSFITQYGYSDIKKKKAVNSNTFFELGSMSKAFTGLGILLLEDCGKISLNDYLYEYLPDLPVTKNKNGEKIKIRDLLYHTSGIPMNWLEKISPGKDCSALKKAVYNFSGKGVDLPGEKCVYSTVNYDILGYLIEVISHEPFENFIRNKILLPLGLKQTFLFRDLAGTEMALGYKLFFGKPRQFVCPEFRGNTPAGYIISCGIDMQRWLRINLGLIPLTQQLKKIIEKSHLADKTVPPQGRYYYAAGWRVNSHQNRLLHGGENPTFSSMIIINKSKQIAACVFANLNTPAVRTICENILKILLGKNCVEYNDRSNKIRRIDNFFSHLTLLCLFFAIGIFLFYFFSKLYINFKVQYFVTLVSLFSVLFLVVFLKITKHIYKKKYGYSKCFTYYVWLPFSVFCGVDVLAILLASVLLILYIIMYRI